MSIEALNQTILLKKQIERKLFWKHIMPMMLVIYVVVLPMFYIVILVNGLIGGVLLIFLVSSMLFSWVIRSVWLNASFGEQMSLFKEKFIEIAPDIKFIEFHLFCHEFSVNVELRSSRENIIKKINEELISHLASLSEHRFSIISFGVILAIIANAISYTLQQAIPIKNMSDIKNHFIFIAIICFLLSIPWSISKGFFDRFSSKKRLRELREYLEWMPVLEKRRAQ